LPALAAVDLDYEFVVVDDSAGVTKKASGVYQQGNILGTVSESGGTPTGAVIESGSNSNGEYVKFADGTMICTQSITITHSPETTPGQFALTFPATFASIDYAVIPTSNPNQSDGFFVTQFLAYKASTSQFRYRTYYNASTGTNDVMYIAIGRWY